MAEDYGVSLKITADTSDLDQIPQKVEASRKEIERPVEQTVEVHEQREAAAPVEHQPETVAVTERRETAAPVEHPAETVAVTEQRETAAPVEHQPETVPVVEQRETAAPVEHPAETVPVVEQREAAAPVKHPAETVEVREKRVVESRGGDIPVAAERTETIKVDPPKPVVVPVKQDPDPLKIAVEPPKPVVVPVKQDPDPVKPKVEQPTPVKVPVDQPKVKPVEVPVKQTPDPLKPKVEQPKPINIKSRFDGTAIGTGINMLRSLRSIATKAMAAFGLFGLAMNGVMAVVSGVRMLHEWLNRAETKAKELREEMARTSYANAVAHAAASYDRLTESIAKANRLEKERNDILAARKQVERNLEDAQLEQSKQREISKLDPNAADYADKRKEIERSFDVKASDAKVSRADEDARANADELYRAAKSKDKEADAIEREYRKQERIVDTAVENKWQAGMAVRRGEAGADEKYKEAEKAFEEAAAKADEIRKAMEQARAEAQSIRNRAAEQAGGNLTVRIQNEANKQRIENERKQEEARAQKENAEKDKRQQNAQSAYTEARDRRSADADFDARFRAAQRRASDPDATEAQRNEAENTQLEMLRGREAEASAELEAAEKELAEEMAKEAKDRDEDRMARARDRASRAQGEQISAAQQREDIAAQIENRRVSSAQDYFGNLAQQIEASRPRGRLQQMGLMGTDRATADIQRKISGDLQRAVELIREQVSLARAESYKTTTSTYSP